MKLFLLLIIFISLLGVAFSDAIDAADPFDGLAEDDVSTEWYNPNWFEARCAYCRKKCCSHSTRPPITEGKGVVQLMHWHDCGYCSSKGCCVGVPSNVPQVKTTTSKKSVTTLYITVSSTCPTTPATKTSTRTLTSTTNLQGVDVFTTVWKRSTRTTHSFTTITKWI
jgi:hypothetical protein